MANEFKVRKGLIVQGSGSIILDIQGSQGELFSVTDSLSGSLFSVNDISGIPIMEVFSDNTIKLGTFNQEAIIVSGSRTGMGIATPQAKLHISGASNSGLFEIDSPAVNNIIYVTGSGNVGIGTNTPKTLLDISSNGGRVRITQNTAGSTFNGIDFINYTGGTDGGLIWNQNTGEIRLNASTSYFPTFYSNNVEAMRITTSGNVGIGETSPSARLEIRGSGATSATTALRVENSNASASLVVLDNGNVGIGTTSPTATLEVSGSTIITGSFNVNAGTTTPHIRGAALRVSELANGAAGTLTLGSVSNIYSDLGAFSFRGGITGTTEFMYLSGSRVGIGTNNPTNTLQVVGGITATSITASIISASSGITGSLFGTSSWAQSASNAINAQTASFLPVGTYQITSSWAQSASNAINAQTASFLPVETYQITSSWAVNALTASFVNTASTNAFVQGGNSFGATALLGTNDTQDLQFETSGSVRMAISSSGNVGIGTTAPLTRLHISGANSDSLLRIQSPASASIMFVSGSGNVGIGTNLPSANLHISGASADSLLLVGSPTNANILFITGSGRVGIGTSTPSQLFEVVRSGNSK